MKILVADDILTNRILAARILEKRGHVVTTVENGAAAIERLIKEDFDLVVMDVQMPVMSGIDAARIIRSTSSPVRRPDVPIVALSAHDDGKRECLNAGVNVFLSKPVRPADFADTVERYAVRNRPSSPANQRNCKQGKPHKKSVFKG